jgi:5-methylcytosine-specific restriction endonuclease McrA
MKKIVRCPLCDETANYQHQLDFWECYSCGTEIWPGTKETKNSWDRDAYLQKTKYGLRQTSREKKTVSRHGSGASYKTLRFEVFKRDGFKCVYCGRSPTKDNVILELDHKTPVVDGGRFEYDNLVTACRDCNQGKGSIPLESMRKTKRMR